MQKAGEGDELLRKADKLCAPSVLQLRLKPDWPAATLLYEQAAKSFTVSLLQSCFLGPVFKLAHLCVCVGDHRLYVSAQQAEAYSKARLAHERAAHGHDRQVLLQPAEQVVQR